MTNPTVDRYRHASRLAALFVAWFVPCTGLDLSITWFGVHHLPDRMAELGIVEANPFTDMSSVEAFVVPEVVALVVGVAMVFGGGMLKTQRLVARGQCWADLRSIGLRDFCKKYDGLGKLSSLLIIMPMIIAIGRVKPVINNAMWLSLGWGLNALFGVFLTTILACVLAVYPAYFMIRKWTI